MASALEQLGQPLSYDQWRDQQVTDFYNTGNSARDFWRGFSQWGKLLNPNDVTFGRKAYDDYVSSWERKYDKALAEEEYQRSKADTSAANALTFAREDSQVSRLVQDYKNAGLNPYSLLVGGNLSSGVVSSQADKPGYSRSKYKKSNSGDDERNKIVTSAIRAIAAVALLAA